LQRRSLFTENPQSVDPNSLERRREHQYFVKKTWKTQVKLEHILPTIAAGPDVPMWKIGGEDDIKSKFSATSTWSQLRHVKPTQGCKRVVYDTKSQSIYATLYIKRADQGHRFIFALYLAVLKLKVEEVADECLGLRRVDTSLYLSENDKTYLLMALELPMVIPNKL
ncbi:unnamed protein product, partial [Arabidopsis lyrata]